MSEESEAAAVAESFAGRIAERSQRLNSRVCLGIDPRPALHPLTHPDRFSGDPAKTARGVVHYFQAIVSSTSELVACYKLQSAFFEAMGIPGMIALAQLLADLRDSGVPVILDGKRGDIDSTAAAYAEAYLADGVFAADALTVNAYLGLDTLRPLIAAAARSGRGLLVVLKTSNPGSADLQDQRLENGKRVWEHLAAQLHDLASASLDPHGRSLIGAVVGATFPEELAEIRRLMPLSLLLVPGFGEQGGGAPGAAAAFDAGGSAVVSASRSLTYLTDQDDFAERSQQAVIAMRDELNEAVSARTATG
ncbi:MAG: orotidine-5'-phosphate decarboxylase [Trueperaceae bacterium]